MRKILLYCILAAVPLFAKQQTIVLGAGCFWGVEKYFSHLYGVDDVTVGYAGGTDTNPNYKKVLANRNNESVRNHAEVVQIVYDDTKISTRQILESFWEIHDPTQGNRQGNDVGTNYRSIILYTTQQQKKLALQTKQEYQQLLYDHGFGTITTQIERLDKFYKAEEYHQDYLQKHPNGYCPNHATGVKFSSKKEKLQQLIPKNAKEIIVVESANCPFCEEFRRRVLANYHGSISIRRATPQQLKNFTIQTKLFATPTILFIENGVEKFSYVGAMNPQDFYKALGAFKLGETSQAYKIAFQKATERSFCRRYDKFKHTKDGVFVDIVSGEILFDTRDRFNSGSGWLSFYKPVKGAVTTQEDNSYGMHRTEVLAKKSGAHLGHLFHDAPGGRDRYCINANVLEFIKREDINRWKKSH